MQRSESLEDSTNSTVSSFNSKDFNPHFSHPGCCEHCNEDVIESLQNKCQDLRMKDDMTVYSPGVRTLSSETLLSNMVSMAESSFYASSASSGSIISFLPSGEAESNQATSDDDFSESLSSVISRLSASPTTSCLEESFLDETLEATQSDLEI